MVLKTSLKIYLEQNYRRLGALPSIEQLNGHNYNPKQKKCKFLLMSQGAFSKNTNPLIHKGFKDKV